MVGYDDAVLGVLLKISNKYINRDKELPDYVQVLTALQVSISTIDPLFLLLFAVKPNSIYSRGIQLPPSHNERGD